MNRFCKYCLKEFEINRKNKEYCSIDCRKKAQREIRLGYKITPKAKIYTIRYNKALGILRENHRKEFDNLCNKLKQLEGGKDGKRKR